MRGILEQAPYPIAVYATENMRLVYANTTALQAWGRKSDVVGKTYHEAFPELASTPIFEQMQNVYITGEPCYLQSQRVNLLIDGNLQEFYFNYSFTALRDDNGNIYGVMNTGNDVTEQAKTQLTTARSEDKYRRLIAESPVATCLFIGPEQTIEFANELMIELWGKGPSVIGKTLLEALPELVDQPFPQLIADVYRSGITFSAQSDLANLEINGKMQSFYFDYSYKALRNDDGEIFGVMEVAVDVTERVHHERMVKESERKFKNLVIHAPVGICIVHGNPLITEIVNDKFLEIVGKTRTEMENRPYWEVLKEAAPVYEPILKRALEQGIPYSADAHKIMLVRNGAEEHVDVNFVFQPLKDEAGKIISVMILAIDVTAQVTTHRMVERSEHKFRSLIAAAPMGIALFIGRELMIETCNEKFEEILGKDYDVKGLRLEEAMPELVTENQPFLKILDDVFTTGVPYQSFGTLVKFITNGMPASRYFDITYTPLLNEQGEVYAILDIAIDVTENTLAQKKIRKSEKNLRNVILKAPVAMCILRGQNFIVEIANNRMLEIWGKSASDIMKKPLFKGLPEAQEQGFEEMLNSVLTTGISVSAYEQAAILPRKSGLETVYLDFVYEAFREADGRISGVMAVATEVTQQVLARKRVEEAEAKARLAIESADLGSYESDLLTGEMLTSERFNRIWGVDRTLHRSELYKYVHPEDRHIREAAHEEAVKTGHVRYELRLLRPDKTVSWVRVKGKLLYNEDDVATTLIGVVQDITEQKQFADQLTKLVNQRTLELHRSNEDLQQFAHVASHDLKEPVRKIKFYSNLLEDQYKDLLPEKGRSYLTKVHNATDRMFSMIEGVLSYSALRASEQEVQKIDLNKIFSNIESDLEVLIHQKNAKVIRQPLPIIDGAEVLIYQMFYNLVNNALKFADLSKQSVVQISSETFAENHLEFVKIKIEDNGIGLEPAYIHQIFNPFTRLNPKDKYEGTGLGLALCKKIAEQHHGSIEATGKTSEGAVFTVILPVQQHEKLLR